MKDTGKNTWLDNLPLHSPPENLWANIEARLDMESGQEEFGQRLAGLPLHQPPAFLWNRIEGKLYRGRERRISYFASAIAAVLFLAYIIHGLIIPEVKKNSYSLKPAFAKTEKHIPAVNTKKQESSVIPELKKQIPKQQSNPVLLTDSNPMEIPMSTDNYSAKREFAFIHWLRMLPVSPENGLAKAELPKREISVITDFATADGKRPGTPTPWLPAGNTERTAPPPLLKKVFPNKGFSLGLDYLPEPISNPDKGSSLYQSFGLLAKYQATVVEFRSGIGISNYSIPADFSANYYSLSTSSGVTVLANGDTIIGLVDGIGGINIHGVEHSSFLNYSLGAGKRIFSNKNLSATFQVGAGFTLLLSESNNLKNSVYDALKNKSNTFINSTESNIPEINRSRFNLLTGFDFNYRLLKKWSIAIEPTFKYYFDPIYYGRNAKAFSTGVRTGVLFKL
jgi:hypothetical protein